MAAGISPLVDAHAAGDQKIIKVTRAFGIKPADKPAPTGKTVGMIRTSKPQRQLTRLALVEPRIRADLPVQPRQRSTYCRVAAPGKRRRGVSLQRGSCD